jgi:hypothetical protein
MMSLVTQDVAMLPPLDSSSPVTNGGANLLPGQGRTLQPTTPRHSQSCTPRQTARRRDQSQDATGQKSRGAQSLAPTPPFPQCRTVRHCRRPPAACLRRVAPRSARALPATRKGGAGAGATCHLPARCGNSGGNPQYWESSARIFSEIRIIPAFFLSVAGRHSGIVLAHSRFRQRRALCWRIRARMKGTVWRQHVYSLVL